MYPIPGLFLPLLKKQSSKLLVKLIISQPRVKTKGSFSSSLAMLLKSPGVGGLYDPLKKDKYFASGIQRL